MGSKTEIPFLLNPQPVAEDQRVQVIPSVFAQSPNVSATSHDSCIAPMKKSSSYNSTKMFIPALSLNMLCTSSSGEEDTEAITPELEHAKQSMTTPETKKTKPSRTRRKTRMPTCKVEDCKNIAVSRGCCVRHGGGSRCTVDGCPNRAKLYKKCFHHGGFNTCATEGCTRKAKRYGHCWSHGGGRICKIPGCQKVSTQNDLCWAHGGGNRCKVEGCSRRSYLKYGYFCVDHASLRV